MEINRTALLRVVVSLFAAIGVAPGEAVASLPGQVRLSVLRMLRAAESATRRLIVIAAQGLAVSERASRPFPGSIPGAAGSGTRAPCFAVLDPLRSVSHLLAWRRPRPARTAPRILVIGGCEPEPTADMPEPAEDAVSAERLCRRLRAMQSALEDLPGQARRLARWRLRRSRASTGRVQPLRVGRPPGYRARPLYPVDTILRDCHALALHALAAPDTS